jgi:hypothetical protein
MENLPREKPKPRWATLAMSAALIAIMLLVLLAAPAGYKISTILSFGLMGLWFLIGYGVSAALAFLLPRYLARRRRSV